jgi:hypothetical protein
MLFVREKRKGREQYKNITNGFGSFCVFCVIRGLMFFMNIGENSGAANQMKKMKYSILKLSVRSSAYHYR